MPNRKKRPAERDLDPSAQQNTDDEKPDLALSPGNDGKRRRRAGDPNPISGTAHKTDDDPDVSYGDSAGASDRRDPDGANELADLKARLIRDPTSLRRRDWPELGANKPITPDQAQGFFPRSVPKSPIVCHAVQR